LLSSGTIFKDLRYQTKAFTNEKFKRYLILKRTINIIFLEGFLGQL